MKFGMRYGPKCPTLILMTGVNEGMIAEDSGHGPFISATPIKHAEAIVHRCTHWDSVYAIVHAVESVRDSLEKENTQLKAQVQKLERERNDAQAEVLRWRDGIERDAFLQKIIKERDSWKEMFYEKANCGKPIGEDP